MPKKIPLTLALSCALLLIACGGSDTTSHNNSNATASNRNAAATNANANTAVVTSSPATTTASGDKIGVAECDDFITKYDACVTGKVPESARAQYKASIEQWRNSWRTLAANPQTKGTLAQACKTAVEQARTSMKSFGCEF